MKQLIMYLWVGAVFLSCSRSKQPPREMEEVSLPGTTQLDVPDKLSEWKLFQEPLAGLNPTPGVVPYELNTPLFSDYARKARFVRIPADSSADYHASEVMDFPVGTVLIKNFYYPNDFRQPEGERFIIETRLLIHEVQGWKALTYVWNEQQNEAHLEIAGRSVPVSWSDKKGVLRNVNYAVPNLAQCKSCHDQSGQMLPIGPSARQLNRPFTYQTVHKNQLDHWAAEGLLTGLVDADQRPKLPVWDEVGSASLAKRARAWLEINCAHCHRAEGPAKNSGLYLTYAEKDRYKLGIMKPPVAAGRGSGGLKYGIVPGKPDESILVHRITSLDPGVMMPEVGRKLRHEEGIDLIRQWITEME